VVMKRSSSKKTGSSPIFGDKVYIGVI